jgi:hypothetical protein
MTPNRFSVMGILGVCVLFSFSFKLTDGIFLIKELLGQSRIKRVGEIQLSNIIKKLSMLR